MSTPSRRRRRDAERNREQLLESAAHAFADRGLSVDVREIAREAGVGIGTLYRHFPTKDDLLRTVIEPDLAEWTGFAERACAEEDAWYGLCTFVEGTLALMVKRRALLDGLAGAAEESLALAVCRQRLNDTLVGLVGRAQRQRALRPDVSAADVGLLMLGLGRIAQVTAAEEPELWRRHTGYVLDGLRSGDSGGTGALSEPSGTL